MAFFSDLPARFLRGRFFPQRSELLDNLREPRLRVRVRFLHQRLTLDLQLHDAPLDLVNFYGQRINLHAQTRGGFINQINRLIRQETDRKYSDAKAWPPQ